ncbi:MAG: ferritin-like domain-containing protein [Nocardioides sp.]
MTDEIDALQLTLTSEHAAVFVLGYLGAQTSVSAQPDLFQAVSDAYAAHRGRRDHVAAAVRDLGSQPVAAEPAYQLPEVSREPAAISAAALSVERACGTAYGVLLASAEGSGRRWALEVLIDSAVRELAFGGEPRAFPGRT